MLVGLFEGFVGGRHDERCRGRCGRGYSYSRRTWRIGGDSTKAFGFVREFYACSACSGLHPRFLFLWVFVVVIYQNRASVLE